MSDDPGFGGDPERLARAAREWWTIIHGTPSEADRQRFARWRDADPAHCAAYDRQQYLWDQGDLLAATRFGQNRGLRRGSIADRRPVLVWATAATVGALLVAGAFSGMLTRVISRPPDQLIASFASPAGQLRTVQLADGSRVTLDAASQLRVAFMPAERRLWLVAGRARFAVVHDAARSFVVNAAGAVVIARGTVFDVDVGASGARIVLLRGSVEVRRSGGALSVSRVLAAGQEIVVDRAGPLTMPHPAPRMETQWPSRMIGLDATPLAEAIAELNRHNTVKIALADPSLGRLRMSGAFQSDDPNGFAAAAAVMFGLEIHRAGNTLTLAAKAAPAPAIK